MRRQAAGHAALDGFALELGRAATAAQLIPIALMHSMALLEGGFSRLAVSDGDALTCWRYEDGCVSAEQLSGFDAALRDASGLSPGDVFEHKFAAGGSPGRALVVQSSQLHGAFYMLAVGREGRRRFDEASRSLMGRISALVEQALDNRRLLDGLRERANVLEHRAAHDHLTGLANRLQFQEEAEAAIGRGRAGAVLLVDLDRFKEVNDTLGHHVGDELLKEVAARIRATVSPGSIIARLGGDEFALLLEPGSADSLLSIARQLHSCLERPVAIDDFAVDVGASIGVAMAAPGHSTLGTLLRRADVAMYAAKEARKAIEVYGPEMDHYRPEALALVPSFRGAVEHDELHVAFQAQFDAHAGRIVGAEALARWSVTGHGPVPPSEFIPIAEKTGLIHPLTHRVMAEAVEQCVSWQDHPDPLRVSVNIAPRVLVEPGFAQRVTEQLSAAGLPPNYLRVEVTETTIMSDPDRAVAALAELSERGISVAIDDFGTGHSSLSYITTLPCDELKIDCSFVKAIDHGDRRAIAVVSAIIGLARDLGIDVVAEGVETERASEQLQQMGCRVLQGFLFGRPITASEFARVLAGTPAGVSRIAPDRRKRRGDDPTGDGFNSFVDPVALLVDAPPSTS